MIRTADAPATLEYADDSANVDANDVRDLNGNQASSPDDVTPTLQA